MNKVIVPLKQQTRSEAVSDLQNSLRLLLEKNSFQLNNSERIAFNRSMRRNLSSYGRATAKVVMQFQKQYQLEATGTVDERTAAVINSEINRVEVSKTYLLKGNIQNVEGIPFSNGLVRIFDSSLRSDALLGHVTTDPSGN